MKKTESAPLSIIPDGRPPLTINPGSATADEAAAAHGAQTACSKGRLYYTYYLKCGFGYQLGVTRLQVSQTLVLVLTCAFGYQLVVTHYLKCFCLINKMVRVESELKCCASGTP